MAEGTIKRLTDKGFGFIDAGKAKRPVLPLIGTPRVSFDELREGQKVSFRKARAKKARVPRTSSWYSPATEAKAMNQDFLREAIRLSLEKMEAGEGGPFGAVIVRKGEIVSRGWNRVTSTDDPTAHAEIVAIRDACSRLGTFSLAGCEIYSSCEPCPMCFAAIYWSRLERIYYAATCEDATAAGFDDAPFYRQLALPPGSRSIQMVQDLRQEACEAFAAWRQKPNRVAY